MVTPTSKFIEVKNIFVRVNARVIYPAKISLDLSIWASPHWFVAMHFHALVGEKMEEKLPSEFTGFFRSFSFFPCKQQVSLAISNYRALQKY